MGVIGAFSAGPISHWTYVICSHYFPGTSWVQVGKKVIPIIAVTCPVQICMTFTLAVTLAGGTFEEAQRKIWRDFAPTYMVRRPQLLWMRQVNCRELRQVNNCFWPPVLALNMKFVALQNQAVVGGIAHAVWNVYLA